MRYWRVVDVEVAEETSSGFLEGGAVMSEETWCWEAVTHDGTEVWSVTKSDVDTTDVSEETSPLRGMYRLGSLRTGPCMKLFGDGYAGDC